MSVSEESSHASPNNKLTPDTEADAPCVKPHACVLCQQRKVKCDRLTTGCTNCTKARVECIYRPPAPPRRRKKGQPPLQQTDLLVKLKHYEDILKSLGVNVDDYQAGQIVGPIIKKGEDVASEELEKFKLGEQAPYRGSIDESFSRHPRPPELGAIVTGEGPNGSRKARYLANALYVGVRNEVSQELLDESSDEEDDLVAGIGYPSPGSSATPGSQRSDVADLILRPRRTHIKLHDMHPSPVVIFKLWQTFLDNVNPLCKTLHIPTTQQLVLESAARLHEVSAATESLLFCIYFVAVTSMSDDDECRNATGENKDTLLLRYQFAAQQALANAGLLKTSDIRVLQAFSLFLAAIVRYYDPRTMWALTGLACRIAQRMGLHRDGLDLGLSVFETEMRRRLWWELIFQDGRMTELSGAGVAIHSFDTKSPLNIDDGRLFPDMKEYPPEHSAPTEMLFAKIRCEIGEWLRNSTPTGSYNGAWNHLVNPTVPQEQKVRNVDWLEERLKSKYLQHIDLSLPLHFLCAAAVQIIVSKMQFLAYLKNHPSQHPTPEERARSFSQALNIIEAEVWFQTSEILTRFKWHMGRHIQYQAFIFLLTEMRTRTTGDDIILAWKTIGQTMVAHAALMKQQAKRPLHAAIGNLTVKAWDAFEDTHGKRAYALVGSGDAPPDYIQILRAQRKLPKTKPVAEIATPPPQTQVQPLTTPTSNDAFVSGNETRIDNSQHYDYWSNAHIQPNPSGNLAQFQAAPVPIQQQPLPQLIGQQPLPQLDPNMTFDFNGSTWPIIDGPTEDIPMDWGQWETMLNSFNNEQYDDLTGGMFSR